MELTFINVYLLNFIVISIVYWTFNLFFETLIDGASNFSLTIQYSVGDKIHNFELIFFNDMMHWGKSSSNMQSSSATCLEIRAKTEIARCKPSMIA